MSDVDVRDILLDVNVIVSCNTVRLQDYKLTFPAQHSEL